VQTKGKDTKKFYEKLDTEIAKQLTKDMKVLELAMGPALLSKGISRHCKELYATDFSEKMVHEARKKELPDNVIVEQADATALLYEDESFDAIVIANALHIMPNPKQAIKEMKRVLKKDGVIDLKNFGFGIILLVVVIIITFLFSRYEMKIGKNWICDIERWSKGSFGCFCRL
jgi:ubiquinone/menaquinone biosynthesis C-methylase UbiE